MSADTSGSVITSTAEIPPLNFDAWHLNSVLIAVLATGIALGGNLLLSSFMELMVAMN